MAKAEQRKFAEIKAHIDRKDIHKGRVLHLVQDTIFLDGKDPQPYEFVLHGGAVVIIPVTHEGDLVFVKQWRRPAYSITIEFPAGGLEIGEEPAVCAQRELREESGLSAKNMQSIGGFFTAPGMSSEYLHFFCGKELTPAPLKGDDSDLIDVVTLSLKTALQGIQKGEIQDLKTVAGILWYDKWLNQDSA